MSFYEGRGRRAGYYEDVHEPPATPATRDAAPAAEPGDWLSLRRSRPVDRLLPVAASWSAALPAGIRPQALVACYPRIANMLALQWNDATACAAYFNDLLVDRRGGRQGFPPPVLQDLLRLRDHWYRSRVAERPTP